MTGRVRVKELVDRLALSVDKDDADGIDDEQTDHGRVQKDLVPRSANPANNP